MYGKVSSAWTYTEVFDVLNSKASNEIARHCKHYKGRQVVEQLKTGANLAKEMGLAPEVLDETFKVYNETASTKDTRGISLSHPHAGCLYVKHRRGTRAKRMMPPKSVRGETTCTRETHQEPGHRRRNSQPRVQSEPGG